MLSLVNKICEETSYDAVVFEFSFMAAMPIKTNAVKIVDEHNIEYNNFKRMWETLRAPARKLFYLREYKKTFVEEVGTCKEMDGIFVTSLADKLLIEKDVPDGPKYIVPNGVDTEYFVPFETKPDPYSIIFTGRMDYAPNWDAMTYFLDEIFPLVKKEIPQAKIYIVGNNPPDALKDRASDDVIVTGFVDDVREYAARASLYVVPLRMGGGTRLKILEGLAMRKPLVTTSIGCEGIDVRDGVEVAIADEPNLFAQKVVDLLRDTKKASALGYGGYKLIKTKYDWESVALRMNEAIQDLVSRGRKTTVPSTGYTLSKRERVMDNEEIRPSGGKTPVKVLIYHRVAGDKEIRRNYSWNVTPAQLRSHLSLLDKWGFTCISFEDYSLILNGKLTLPKKPIILTFDDGYTDVHESVLPCVRDFGAKATIFALGDRNIRTNKWDEPMGVLGASLMSDDQIVDLHRNGFEIGSHSMTHKNLSRVSREEAWEEIVKSKDALENLVQSPIRCFAYPFGANNEELKTMVQACGYEYGCGVFSGPPRFTSDLFDIRRIPITSTTNVLSFAMKLLTPYEYYGWLRWEAGEKVSAHKSRAPQLCPEPMPKEPSHIAAFTKKQELG